jgi:hypothetical protein
MVPTIGKFSMIVSRVQSALKLYMLGSMIT